MTTNRAYRTADDFFADRTDSDQNAIRGDSREFENSGDLELVRTRENLATASAEGKTTPSSRIRDLQILPRTNARPNSLPRTPFETNAQLAFNFENNRAAQAQIELPTGGRGWVVVWLHWNCD